MGPHECNDCQPPFAHKLTSGQTPTFVRRIDTSDVFQQMIIEEMRNGRLTSASRRRIVRYAAGLKMSAVEAGRLIDQCRDELLNSDNSTARHHALRIAEPDPVRISIPFKVSIAIAVLIVVNLLITHWPW